MWQPPCSLAGHLGDGAAKANGDPTAVPRRRDTNIAPQDRSEGPSDGRHPKMAGIRRPRWGISARWASAFADRHPAQFVAVDDEGER